MGVNDIYGMGGSPGLSQNNDTDLSARLARIENIVPMQLRGGSFANQKLNAFLPIDSPGITDGKLNLTVSGGSSFVGSMAPGVIDGAFTVACPSDSTATMGH